MRYNYTTKSKISKNEQPKKEIEMYIQPMNFGYNNTAHFG